MEEKTKTYQELQDENRQLKAQATIRQLKETLSDEASFRLEVLKVLDRIAEALEKHKK